MFIELHNDHFPLNYINPVKNMLIQYICFRCLINVSEGMNATLKQVHFP